jgi:hypothetical protein
MLFTTALIIFFLDASTHFNFFPSLILGMQ